MDFSLIYEIIGSLITIIYLINQSTNKLFNEVRNKGGDDIIESG